MFNYISGTVAHIFGNTVVVDVNGIGYEILATTRTTEDLTIGQNAKLFTYLQVREDGVSLFGFATLEEKTMFLKYGISIPSVVHISLLKSIAKERMLSAGEMSPVQTYS